MPKPTCLLDALRDANPDLGFALYAYTPGGAVTLEVHTPDAEVFTFKAPTAGEAIAMAFPETGAGEPIETTAPAEPADDIFG